MDNILVFGRSGIGKATMISECIDMKGIPWFNESNSIEINSMNTLYNISHPHKSHTYKRIPYKYGKHSNKREVNRYGK